MQEKIRPDKKPEAPLPPAPMLPIAGRHEKFGSNPLDPVKNRPGERHGWCGLSSRGPDGQKNADLPSEGRQ
jgi:hypothetical protein